MKHDKTLPTKLSSHDDRLIIRIRRSYLVAHNIELELWEFTISDTTNCLKIVTVKIWIKVTSIKNVIEYIQ